MAINVLDVCLAGLALFLVGRLVRKSPPLPPGPPGWPLIGNLLDFRDPAPYEMFGAMGKRYGPIVYFNVMGRRYVALNSFQAAHDLLEKRSAITSDRPHRIMAGDLVGWDNATPLLQYGDTHRKHRKFFYQQIGSKSGLEALGPVEEQESKQFMRNVLGNPGNLNAHSRRMASSVILKISHGYTVKGDGDPVVEMVDETMHMFSVVMTPGRFPVDMFPILRYLPAWFPGGGFRKEAKRWREMLRKTADAPYQLVLEHLAKGDALPSFTSRVLQEGVTPEDEEILKWMAFTMYVGGSETTAIALSSFFLAMTLYPEVFKKGQAEVDKIVGNAQLPTLKDRDALPYVDAICKETLRWYVGIPAGTHVTIQDMMYEGYFIPKGTCLLGNVWFILSDPNTYPDPDVFNPERFLGEDQQPDPREVCFGWGRRICPGALMAETTIFICVAMALATLNVSRCVENGVEVVPKCESEGGTIRHLKPFKCDIVSRSKQAEELLHA